MTQEPKKKWTEDEKREWYDIEPPLMQMAALTLEKPQTYAEATKGEEENIPLRPGDNQGRARPKGDMAGCRPMGGPKDVLQH